MVITPNNDVKRSGSNGVWESDELSGRKTLHSSHANHQPQHDFQLTQIRFSQTFSWLSTRCTTFAVLAGLGRCGTGRYNLIMGALPSGFVWHNHGCAKRRIP
jgi:hypothetical protein